MNTADHWLTHIDNEEDEQYLKRKLPNVNLRLMSRNEKYRKIVLACCELLKEVCLKKLDDYKLPHGVSGANIAIPFNIIAIAVNRGTANATVDVMINPVILQHKDHVFTKSNCGSIRLPKPIEIDRFREILVSWWDMAGSKHTNLFTPETGSYTIQHEVDHNQGILITDRKA